MNLPKVLHQLELANRKAQQRRHAAQLTESLLFTLRIPEQRLELIQLLSKGRGLSNREAVLYWVTDELSRRIPDSECPDLLYLRRKLQNLLDAFQEAA